MKKEKTEKVKFTIDSESFSMFGAKVVIPKSHSIIALNLQTVEDVEQVIRQCEALKGQMQGGSDEKFSVSQDGSLPIVSADWVDDAIAFFSPKKAR